MGIKISKGYEENIIVYHTPAKKEYTAFKISMVIHSDKVLHSAEEIKKHSLGLHTLAKQTIHEEIDKTKAEIEEMFN